MRVGKKIELESQTECRRDEARVQHMPVWSC
jgi:hypothetical protein